MNDTRADLGALTGHRRPEEVLLVCYFEPYGISTVRDNIAHLQRLSKFKVKLLNLFEDRVDTGVLKLNPKVDIDRYEAILIHNTVAYNPDNLEELDALIKRKFQDYEGVKVLVRQDEHFRTRRAVDYVARTGFDVIFTCLPSGELPKVYPRALVGEVVFVQMLTGYVTPNLRNMDRTPRERRNIDIGYRGSVQPLVFGRLAYEKRKIGEDVLRLAKQRGLVVDISSRWEDRFFGEDWFEFLLRCKATLGVETGPSVFDLDGTLEERFRVVELELAPYCGTPEYADLCLEKLSDLEGQIYYNQISPRHFEAAATGTLQLLYPGRCSGIFESGRHYVPLERDYSNFDRVVDAIRDDRTFRDVTQCAYEEIIQNPKYWIETFVETFDDVLAAALERKHQCRRSISAGSRDSKNVLLLAAHDPHLDPRLGWLVTEAPPHHLVHQLGVSRQNATELVVSTDDAGRLVIVAPKLDHALDLDWLMALSIGRGRGPSTSELDLLKTLLEASDSHLERFLGARPGAGRSRDFRWYLRYFLDTNATLIKYGALCRGTSAIIATDLDTLPAASILGEVFAVPVLYDAHEFWSEADVSAADWEKQFWLRFESRLLTGVTAAHTVSPQLADLLSRVHGREFICVPNAARRTSMAVGGNTSPGPDESGCKFLFQGVFAQRRGIDLLIRTWPLCNDRAILLLRGPDSPYKAEMITLAKSLGLLDTRVFFPPAVREEELIRAASEADVGLIPYEPYGANYRFCCPNKLSQYMAAGLPIISNRLDFVAALLATAGCGTSVDFSKLPALAEVVNKYVLDPKRRQKEGLRAKEHFLSDFNWNRAAEPLYRNLELATADGSAENFVFFLPRRNERSNSDPQLGGPDVLTRLTGAWRKLPPPVRKRLRPLARAVYRLIYAAQAGVRAYGRSDR